MNPSTPPSRSPAASASQRSAARRVVDRVGDEGRRDDDEPGHALGVLEREAQQRVRAHRRAGEHGAVDPAASSTAPQVAGERGVGVRPVAPATTRRARARRRRPPGGRRARSALRAHDDVAVRRRQPVEQHDRRPLAARRRRRASRRRCRPCVRPLARRPTLEAWSSTSPRQTFEQRGHRPLARRSPSSSTSGPSGAAPAGSSGPCSRRRATEREGQVVLAKLDTDANPRHLAAAFGIQGIPAVKAFKDGRVVDEFVGAQPPRAWSSASSTGCVPSEADGLVEAGDEASLRRALELEPGRADAAVALARLLRERGEDDEALELLEAVAGSFAAEGLAARIRLEQAGDPELDRGASPRSTPATARRALDALLAAFPPPTATTRRPAPHRRRHAGRARRRATRWRASPAAGWPPRCTSRDARDTLPSGPHGHRPPGRRRVLRDGRASAPARAAGQAGDRRRPRPARGRDHRLLRGAALRRRVGDARVAGAPAVPATRSSSRPTSRPTANVSRA